MRQNRQYHKEQANHEVYKTFLKIRLLQYTIHISHKVERNNELERNKRFILSTKKYKLLNIDRIMINKGIWKKDIKLYK